MQHEQFGLIWKQPVGIVNLQSIFVSPLYATAKLLAAPQHALTVTFVVASSVLSSLVQHARLHWPSHMVAFISIAILLSVTDQETVDRLAVLAKPRLTSLLRLRNVLHVYEPTPSTLNSVVVLDGKQFTLDKLKRSSQPYRDIERFLTEEKVMQYIIDPGLLPLVTALSKDIAGKKVLVTRRVAARDDDKGAVGHLDGFGVRIMMYFDEAARETIVEWGCLYCVF